MYVLEVFSKTSSEAGTPSCIKGELAAGRTWLQRPHDEPVVPCTRCKPQSRVRSCLPARSRPLGALRCTAAPPDSGFAGKPAALMGWVPPAAALLCLEEGIQQGHGCCTASGTRAGPLHWRGVTGMLCACRTASAEAVQAAAALPRMAAVLVGCRCRVLVGNLAFGLMRRFWFPTWRGLRAARGRRCCLAGR